MRLKAQRRAIYAAMGLTVLALVGGYALANINMGTTNSAQQGSVTTTVGQVTGLVWSMTTLTVVPSGFTNTAGCTSAGGCSVTSSSAINCAGGLIPTTTCAQGDFIEQVILTTVAGSPFAGTIEITLYVTSVGVTYPGASFNYTDTTGNTQQTITQDFDVGSAASGPAVISAVSVVVNLNP